MKKIWTRPLRLLSTTAVLLALGCGGGTIEFKDVAAIPAGDKEGVALSGTFSVFFEITSDGCAHVAALEVPVVGSKVSVDVTVTQDQGAITFDKVEEILLRGGIDFDSTFEAGGAAIISRTGTDNILRLVHLNGNFQDKDTFSGTGDERLTGRVGTEDVDCIFSFKVSGVRKAG